METRVFNREVSVFSSDGARSETFKRGDRVKHIRRIARGVIFEPADPYHVAGTYSMEWSEFVMSTVAVAAAGA